MADASFLSGETGRFCSHHGKIGENPQLTQHASALPCPGTDRHAMDDQSEGTQMQRAETGRCFPETSRSKMTKCFPNKELAKQQYMKNVGAEHIATLARRLGKDERTLARQIGFVIQMVETIDGQPSSFEVMGLQAYIPTSDGQGSTEVRFSAKGHYINPGIRFDGTVALP